MATASGVIAVSVTQGGKTVNLSTVADVLPSFVETRDFDGEDAWALKFVEEMVVEVEGEHGLEVKVKGRETLSDAFVEAGPFEVSSGVDPVFCWADGANYIRLRFTDETTAGRWKLNRFSIYGQVAGKRW